MNALTPAVVSVTGFTTSLLGCESQLVYSCSSCTDPTLVVFYNAVPIRLEFGTSSNLHVGQHTFIVDAGIAGGQVNSWNVVVTVLPDCNFAAITGGEPNELVKYDISSKKEVVISPPAF